MHECRSVESLPRLLVSKFLGREMAQLVVHQRQKVVADKTLWVRRILAADHGSANGPEQGTDGQDRDVDRTWTSDNTKGDDKTDDDPCKPANYAEDDPYPSPLFLSGGKNPDQRPEEQRHKNRNAKLDARIPEHRKPSLPPNM
jgi:hypothetical protein